MSQKTVCLFVFLLYFVLFSMTGCKKATDESSSVILLEDAAAGNSFPASAGSTPAVQAFFAEDISLIPDKIILFTDPEIMDDVFSHVIVTSTSPIHDIRFFKLGYNDNGSFTVDDILTEVPVLNPNEVLQFDFTFYDLPTRGMIYTDADNILHTCYFAQSGQTGELLLCEFDKNTDIPYAE